MAAKHKNYDKYGLFISSRNDKEEKKDTIGQIIFGRRREALQSSGDYDNSGFNNDSAAEIFRKRKKRQLAPSISYDIKVNDPTVKKESDFSSYLGKKSHSNNFYPAPIQPGTGHMPSIPSLKYRIEVDDPDLLPKESRGLPTYLTDEGKYKSEAVPYPEIVRSNPPSKIMGDKIKAKEREREAAEDAKQYVFGPSGYQVKNNNPNVNSGQFLIHGEKDIPAYDYIKYADLPQQPDHTDAVARSKIMPDEPINPLAKKKPWNQLYVANELKKAWGASDEDMLGYSKFGDTSYDSDIYSWMRRDALMDDQQHDIYNYMFGKYGSDAAAQYMRSIQDSLVQKGAAARYAESKKTPGPLQMPNNIIDSFGEGTYSAIKGFAALPDFFLGRKGDYAPDESEYFQQMKIDNAPWAEGMAYKLSSGIGNMVPSILAGAATGGATTAGEATTLGSKLAAWAAKGAVQRSVFSVQAGAQQYRQDIRDGRPVEGAQVNAVLTAADEAATDWLLNGISVYGGGTIKKLLGDTKVAKAAKQGISSALAKSPAIRRAVMGSMEYGADMLSEGTQEAVQDFTQALREHFIYGDELDLKGVATDPQTWEDFALGALTAGVMNAPGAIANNLAINQYGKSIDQDYREYAQGIDTNRESYKTDADHQHAVNLQSLAQEYAERQANKEFIPNRDKAEYEMNFAKFQDDLLGKEYEAGKQAEEESPHSAAQEPERHYNQPEMTQARENAPAEPKADNVAHNKPEKTAVDMWAEPYGSAGQKAFKEIYDGQTDLKTYYQSFGRAYNIGRYNMQPTQQQQAEAAVILGVDGFSAAFKAGAHDRPEIGYDPKTESLNGMAKGAQKEGGLGIAAQSATEAQKMIATHVGKLTGLQINLVDGLENQNAAASYSKGKITLSVNSNDFIGSTTHELTHYIKDYAPDAYQVYTDHAVRAITEAEGVGLENMINDYSAAYEQQTGRQLSREEAIDEIVADATQKFFNDPDYISRAIKKDSTIGQRIVDFLTDVIDAIKALAKNASTRKAAKALEENFKYYEQCRQEWITGLEEAGVRYKEGWETNESETRFQLKDPMEETKDLIAVHNLSENKLLGNFKLGGIPMPSIAVTKADIGHSNFGDISLVFKKDTIDPVNRKNKVYGADAWTPTFPRIEYEADEKAARKVTDTINKLSEKLPDEYSHRANAFVSGLESNLNNYGGESGIIEHALKDYGMKAAYLASQGEPVEVKIKKTKEEIPKDSQTLYKTLLSEFGEESDQMKGSGKEIYEKFGDRIKAAYIKGLMELGESEDAAWDIADKKKKYGLVAEMRNALKYRDTGATITTEAPDYAGAEKNMNSRIDEGKYKDWLNGLFVGVEKSQGIHNGKDYFTPAGNRRSFKQLHYELTAENVVKSMISQSDDVKNVAGWQGVKSVRAKVADDFKSIDQLKNKSKRLKDIDTESYNTMLEGVENRLYATMRQIADNRKSKSGNSFLDMSTIGECLLEAYEKPTPENIRAVMEKYRWTVTADQAQELASIAEDVYNMPVDMYEAKPQRVVDFGEIAAAVIPTTASEELKTELHANGINTITYDPNLPDARRKAVNDLKDVRFQLEDVDTDEDQTRTLQRENKSLREANELLKKEFELTGKTEPRLSDVKKVSTDFLRKYNSGYNHNILTNNLVKIYDYIRSSDQADMGMVNDLATGIARSILKNSKSTSEFAEQYQDLKKQIKGTKIKITDQDKADLAQMGGYNNFRKQYFGKLKLGNDGISIDSLYQELSAENPEMFDRNITHPADQLIAVASAIDTMTDQVANPYGADMDEMSYIVGQEILQAYTKVQEVPATFADKKAVELQQVKRQYNQKLTDYKNEIKKKYDQTLYQVRKENIAKIGELAKRYRDLSDARMVDRAEYRVKMDRLRNDKNQAMAAMQQRHREQLQQRRDSLRAREAKKGIIKQVRELDRWLLEPNDKKHVPESLRMATAQFLQSIDFSSDWTNENGNPAQRTVLWNDLSRKLDGILKNGGVSNEEGEQRILDIDPSLPDKINALAEKVKDIDRLEDMKADDLERLHESVTTMKKLIQDANQMISNANYRTVENAAVSFLSETDSKKNRMAFTEKSAVGKVDKLLNEDMLTPYTIFWRMGPVMRSIHKELAAGEDRHTSNMAEMVKYFQDTCKELGVTKKEFKNWTGAKAEQKTFVIGGKEIKLTTAQIMELYELNKRNQGRLHIYQGGIVPSDRIKQDEGRIKKIAYSALGIITPRQSPVKVMDSDVRRITSTLTPKQIDLADRLQHFLEYNAADWGNETSMRQYGYKKFRPGTHYYPVQSYENAIRRSASEVGMDALSSIKNIGAAKATKKDARNALVVNDIFDTFIRHSNQMSMYNAMLCPLTDFQKVYNYKSEDAGNVKEEMERIWGKNNSEYLDKLIKDINGKVKNPDQGLNALWMKNMKAASVAMNLRVAIQQPTAMTRALSVLSLGDMAAGTLMKSPTLSGKEQWETMCKYAPIVQWKEWGFYKMDASRSMREILLGSDSIKDAAVNKSMFLAEKGDEWAWRRMWNACEYETIKKHPELKKGSEEYYRTAGKRFSEVIDATQVVDSVLHRTQIARNPDGLVKTSAAFMNEPLQSYNMLYRAAIEARETGNIKKAFPVMATAGAIYAANALTTAALASIIDAIRDDDKDKKFVEKYLTALGENSLDNLNPLNMVPVLKDVVSIFQGFTAKRVDLSGIEDISRTAKEWMRYFDGESEYTKSYLATKTLESLSNITGVPIKSLSRDIIKPLVRGMYNFSGSGEYGLTKRDYNIGSKKNIGRYAELMVDAMLDGDEKKMEQIKSDMLAAGLEEGDISSKYDSEYKNYLTENVPEIAEAAQARLDGKPEEYKRINDKLVGAGYEQAYIKKAVDSTLNKMKKESGTAEEEEMGGGEEAKAAEVAQKAESIYTSYDLLSSIEQFNNSVQSLKAFNVVAEDMYQAKRSSGKTKTEAIGAIKSTITSAYKKQWIDAYRRKDRATYEAIQSKLKYLKIDGVTIYNSKDWGIWVDAARKKD